MRNWLCLLAVLVASAAAAQMPSGPVLMGGVVFTPQKNLPTTNPGQTVTVDGWTGPAIRAGYELGDRFNSEFSFQLTRTWTTGHDSEAPSIPVNLALLTLAGGYNFTVDIAKKEGWSGFTPFIGAGLYIGSVDMEAQASAYGSTAFAKKSVVFLEFHAMAGLRYTLKSGLGFKGEVAFTTYGGFVGWQGSLGVAYRI